jgi:hypothetical protein
MARQYDATDGPAPRPGAPDATAARPEAPRRAVPFTCGWMITAADEDAKMQVPGDAWKPGTGPALTTDC